MCVCVWGAPHTHVFPFRYVKNQVEMINPRPCCGSFLQEPFSSYSLRSLTYITYTMVGPQISKADIHTVTKRVCFWASLYLPGLAISVASHKHSLSVNP